MIQTPHAEWYTQGTPKSVKQDVRNDVNRAADKATVPVLVAYNIPFRDCAQFGAGGATTRAEYEAWIDGFAAGIGEPRGRRDPEPDGLGIIPQYDPYAGADGSSTPGMVPTCGGECGDGRGRPVRDAQLRGRRSQGAAECAGVSRRNAQRMARRWRHRPSPGTGRRDRADGFYFNASNYQFTTNSIQYGTWISSCLARRASTPERVLRVSKPVLERRAAAGKDRRPAGRVDRRGAQRLRRVERRERRPDAQHIRAEPSLARGATEADHPFRGRHQPQRARSVVPPTDRPPIRRTGATPRSWPGSPPHR